MLTAISWKQFLEGIAMLCIAYYAVIGLLYYRPELKSFLSRKQLPAKDQLTPTEPVDEPLDRKLMGEVHDLMQEINIVFNEAEQNKYIDKELCYALQLALKNFRHIEPTHFAVSINNYISATAASHCAISLTGDDLAALWKD